MRRRQQAFTLIELLVAMAITVILLGLIFGPMVQGFNLTNRARVQVQSQDTARTVMEGTQRDMANGVFVFDNTSEPLWFWAKDPTGASVPVPVYYASIDLVPPVRYIDQQGFSFLQQHPELIDPTTGVALANPQLREALTRIGPQYAFMADPALPLSPGRTIIRYWVGLRDNTSQADPGGASGRPVKPYTNFYDDTRRTTLADHNPYVLYRAVVSPFLPDGSVDRRFFRVDSQGRPIVYDPNFFYDMTVAPAGLPPVPGFKDLNGDGQAEICENWKAIARALVPTDRADEVTLQRDDNGAPLYLQMADPRSGGATIQAPRLTPLARFQPTFVGNDAGVATNTHDPGNEMPNIAPSTNQETYGAWTTPYRLFVFRSALSANPLAFYYWDGSTGSIRYQEYNSTSGQITTDRPANFYPLLFDADANGVNIANPPASSGTPPEIMFTADPRRGIINFAFPDWIWLHDGQGRPQPSTFSAQQANQTYADYTAAQGGPTGALRYVSLATLDTTLNPGVTSPLTSIPNCRVVPGSELVYGPDQRPGPHQGKRILYTRVARAGDPTQVGLNEYMINYTDLPNKPASPGSDAISRQNYYADAGGTIIFDSQDATGTPANALPTTDADGNPAAPIVIAYQIQNNLPGDIVKADYLTRQLMTFSLGVRLYDFSSGQPQQVNLTQKIKVRNLQR